MKGDGAVTTPTIEERARKLLHETAERRGEIAWPGVKHVADAIRAAVEAEREGCAEVADRYRATAEKFHATTVEILGEHDFEHRITAADAIAGKIRARSEGTG